MAQHVPLGFVSLSIPVRTRVASGFEKEGLKGGSDASNPSVRDVERGRTGRTEGWGGEGGPTVRVRHPYGRGWNRGRGVSPPGSDRTNPIGLTRTLGGVAVAGVEGGADPTDQSAVEKATKYLGGGFVRERGGEDTWCLSSWQEGDR